LVVLGFWFEVVNDANQAMYKITETFENIEYAGQSFNLPVFAMTDIIGPVADLGPYYRYYGSLTTPPCTEVVVWTLFEKKIPIKADQLQRFRMLIDHERYIIENNYRPTQPLNSRRVLFSGCKETYDRCETCFIDFNNTVCTRCEKGYGVGADKKSCIRCRDTYLGCDHCTFDNNGSRCTECERGYVPSFDKQSCVGCNEVVSNCDFCVVEDHKAICRQCKTGFVKTSDRTCTACGDKIANCLECDSDGKVTKCSVCAHEHKLSCDRSKCLESGEWNYNRDACTV